VINLLSRWVEWLLVALVLCMALWSGRALADLIPAQATQEVTAPRIEVIQQLEAYGIAPEHARQRVDAMNDAEVAALADKLDALPAAGAASNEQVIIVVLLVVLLLILL